MRMIFRILVFFLICQVTMAQSQKKPQDIIVMEKMADLRKAIIEKDSLQLQRLLADDVTYGHTNGWIQTKSEFIHSVISREQDYKDIKVSSAVVRVFGKSAIINMRADVSLEMESKHLDLNMNILQVWVKNKNGWQLVARQSVKNN